LLLVPWKTGQNLSLSRLDLLNTVCKPEVSSSDAAALSQHTHVVVVGEEGVNISNFSFRISTICQYG
jgi:hypothetical protein